MKQQWFSLFHRLRRALLHLLRLREGELLFLIIKAVCILAGRHTPDQSLMIAKNLLITQQKIIIADFLRIP